MTSDHARHSYRERREDRGWWSPDERRTAAWIAYGLIPLLFVVLAVVSLLLVPGTGPGANS